MIKDNSKELTMSARKGPSKKRGDKCKRTRLTVGRLIKTELWSVSLNNQNTVHRYNQPKDRVRVGVGAEQTGQTVSQYLRFSLCVAGDLLLDLSGLEDPLSFLNDHHLNGYMVWESDGCSEVLRQRHQQVQDGHYTLGMNS